MRLSIRVSPAILLVVLLAIASSSFSQCVIPSSENLNADESAANRGLTQVLVDASTCPSLTAATQKACQKRSQELTALRAAAIALQAADGYCAYTGKDTSNSPLPAPAKTSYTQHAQFWADLAAAIPDPNDGSVDVNAFQARYLSLSSITLPIAPPSAPTTSTKIVDGATVLQVQAQKVDTATYPSQAKLQVCVFSGAAPVDPDCTKAQTPTSSPSIAPVTIVNGGADGKTKANYINADSSGSASITLATAISAGNTVYFVQYDKDAAGGNQQAVISKPYPVTVTQCNKKFATQPFSDCDWTFSIIGGIEQSGLAAEATQTEGFLRVFTRAGVGNKFQTFAAIRLLGAPTQSSASGVVSAFSNPDGTITTQSLTSVGYAIDYSVGFETLPWFHAKHRWSVSAIGEFGGTTPLNSTTIAAAYKAPAYGTVECQQFFQRFQNYFNLPTYNIAQGTATNVTPPTGSASATSCLVNKNDPSGTSPNITYAPINNIGFSNQDRTAFLGKWYGGVRTINRFRQKNAVACGDTDPANGIAPCARGIVDVLFGADASINGGLFRPWVFKVDAVHPMPIKGTSYLYIFGSFSVRMAHNMNQTPLVLQAGDLSALTGTGSTAVPNVNTVVLPLVQPNRDFYRFGIGLDVSCIFTKIFGSTSDCSAFASTGSSTTGS